MVGDAVKVTGVPSQIVIAGDTEIVTEGVTFGWKVSVSIPAVDVKQVLAAVTEILPVVAVPMSTVIFAVPAPPVMLAPEGTVQL